MAAVTPERVWLPLGNAQIIDWASIDHAPSARGATAWVGALGGETTLVRTWCEETATHFEFAVLAHPRLRGVVSLHVTRPETHRQTVRIEAEVPGELAFGETTEFEEHPRTGLHGAKTRAIDVRAGAFDPAGNPGLTAPQVEILEYAPESALHTGCGPWLAGVLERIRAHVVDGAHVADQASTGVPALAAQAPAATAPGTSPRSAPPSAEARRPAPSAAHHPAPSVAEAESPRLFAATDGGDSWEIVDDETYIGRSKQCPVVLRSQRVSRRHASITREGDGWYINDLGAANGIWAGAQKVERERIEHGSEFVIGDVLLTFTFS